MTARRPQEAGCKNIRQDAAPTAPTISEARPAPLPTDRGRSANVAAATASRPASSAQRDKQPDSGALSRTLARSFLDSGPRTAHAGGRPSQGIVQPPVDLAAQNGPSPSSPSAVAGIHPQDDRAVSNATPSSPLAPASGSRSQKAPAAPGSPTSSLPSDPALSPSKRSTRRAPLSAARPDLAAQWDFGRNGDLAPDDVTPGSNKRAWWKCPSGHSYEATVKRRSSGGGCPYCSGSRVLTGFNDLATTHPDIAAEWHPSKNGETTPQDVTAGSERRAWWLGKCGHEWRSRVADRAGKGAGCPYCSGSRALPGFSDLATTHPALAAEWDCARNGALTPQDVTAGSGRTVWWKCGKGHAWRAAVHSRARGEHSCPYCSGRLAVPGVTDLATVWPDLAAEWHPTRNGALTPRDVKPSSNRSVWWRCKLGHEWRAATAARTRRGDGCPYCSNRRALAGFNDLATTRPDIAAEWHPAKNGELAPQDVTAGSCRAVWWRCEHGHEWRATVSGRTAKGKGCPYCANRRLLPGFNDLATKHPGLAREWHPDKNGDLKPSDVPLSSKRLVWWKCERGHEWRARVKSRADGTSCPVCTLIGSTPQGKARKVRTAASATTVRVVNDVAARRRELGMSQGDFALFLGVSRDVVSKMETGAATPSVEQALVMADVLDCRVEDLYHVVKGGRRLIDLTGKRYGALTVVRRLAAKPKAHDSSALWACRCDCGALVEARSADLRAGRKLDCGCGLGAGRQPEPERRAPGRKAKPR